MLKSRIGVFLLAGIALILAVLAAQLLVAGEQVEREGAGGALIAFSADRDAVLAPGGCVTVRWQVDHIQAVYLNDQATVGQGFETVCLDGVTLPALRVEFTDNTSAEYVLPVKILIYQPVTWLLVSAAVLLGLAFLFTLLVRPAPAAEGTGGRPRSWVMTVFAGVGLLVVGLALTALVLELGLRFYFGQYGTRDEKIAYMYSRAEIMALESQTVTLPFIEYGLSPDFPGHNTLGYRGDEVAFPKPNNTFRIVVYGDSSTYGTTNPYNETYPYYLGEVLRDERGYENVEVVNAGVAGFTSWNSLVDFSLRGIELEPDLVVVYQGGNDVMPREVSPDCYRAASPFLGLDPRRQLRAQPGELSASVLYRFVSINAGWGKNPAESDGGMVGSLIGCDMSQTDPVRNVPANPPIYFEHNVRNMIGIAQANDIPLLLMTYAYNPNSEYAYPYWREAVREHNAITARLAEETGTLFLDYATSAPTDADFWNDSIHMTRTGNLETARTLANFLVDQGVIPAD